MERLPASTLKPGMKERLPAFEAEVRETNLKGFVSEFTLSTDDDPDVSYELVMFESKESSQAVADDPEQDRRYHQLLEFLGGPPKWHDATIIHASQRGS